MEPLANTNQVSCVILIMINKLMSERSKMKGGGVGQSKEERTINC